MDKQKNQKDIVSELQLFQEEIKKTSEKILNSLNQDSISTSGKSILTEIDQILQQLHIERQQTTRLSAELSKCMELNLRLQMELEETRSRHQKALNEEIQKRASLEDCIKKMEKDLELATAYQEELKRELQKCNEINSQELSRKQVEIEELLLKIQNLETQNQQLHQNFDQLKKTTDDQNKILKSIGELATQKLAEVQLALHKKTTECTELQSRLQQAVKQLEIVLHENKSLKQHLQRMSKPADNLGLEKNHPIPSGTT